MEQVILRSERQIKKIIKERMTKDQEMTKGANDKKSLYENKSK